MGSKIGCSRSWSFLLERYSLVFKFIFSGGEGWFGFIG